MAEAVDHGYCSSTCPGCPTPEIGEPWPRLASLSAPTTSRTRGRFPVSFRKPSPWPSPSRRPSPRDARALMSPSAGRDKPLQGAKAGRVTVLPQGVVFTALHAGRPGGRAVAYAPQAEMSCLSDRTHRGNTIRRKLLGEQFDCLLLKRVRSALILRCVVLLCLRDADSHH